MNEWLLFNTKFVQLYQDENPLIFPWDDDDDDVGFVLDQHP